MEAEEKRTCLRSPAETAVLLTPTSNLPNPRIRSEPKLLFIPISIHHTFISMVQDRRFFLGGDIFNFFPEHQQIECQTIMTIKLKVQRLSSSTEMKTVF